MGKTTSLDAFFKPKSVAIVGASSDPKKPGHTALKNLVSLGYKGKVFPVNPREDSILGFRCCRNMLDIPEPVDVCVLLVSADLTMKVADELVERKRRFDDVTAAVCMSAGFGELNTSEGKERERDLVRTLSSASIRLMGPNCVGVFDTYSGFNTNFDISTYPKGGVSVLTQSGAFANSMLFWAERLRLIGVSKFASIGNMADVTMGELLNYLKDDDSTRVIALYMEGFSRPREFFEIARKVSARKPIVVMKTGRSDMGSKAALSHTGSVAGSDAIYDGAFKQAGLLRAGSILEFYDTIRAFEKQPVPGGNRVSILTHMGGPGTICIDEISANRRLELAKLSPSTEKALKSICAPMANIGSPDGYVDLTAAHYEKLHNEVLQILFRDRNIDMVLQILAPSAFLDQKLLVEEIREACRARQGEKTFLNAVTFGEFAYAVRQGLEDAGMPTYEYSDMLARVAGNMATYAVYRKSRSGRTGIPKYRPDPQNRSAKIISGASSRGRISLLEPEAYKVCGEYGIKVPPYRVVGSVESALAAARKIGYPVALKVVSEEILHKTDAGGVMLGIDSDGALKGSYKRLAANVKKAAPGLSAMKVLVQKMIPSNTELVLGALRDKSFGPTVMFGMGGIYVEALKMVGFRLSPVSPEEAKNLIVETLPPPLIRGVRGRDPMNVDAIAGVLVSLGRLLEEQPQIEEVDFNPVLPYRDGCIAVDARIIIAK
ncbi:MAG: acetate--CoA ligase family protein [Acidobacteria bacterium]|nr:acetate--CoA ligase family protein [Acidobacteriota bacterium]